MSDEWIQHGHSITHTVLTPGQIDDQRARSNSGDAAGEPRVLMFFGAMTTNRLRDAGRSTLDDGTRCLGCVVARGEASTACCQDQIHCAAIRPRGEASRNRGGIIGHGSVLDDVVTREA